MYEKETTATRLISTGSSGSSSSCLVGFKNLLGALSTFQSSFHLMLKFVFLQTQDTNGSFNRQCIVCVCNRFQLILWKQEGNFFFIVTPSFHLLKTTNIFPPTTPPHLSALSGGHSGKTWETRGSTTTQSVVCTPVNKNNNISTPTQSACTPSKTQTTI